MDARSSETDRPEFIKRGSKRDGPTALIRRHRPREILTFYRVGRGQVSTLALRLGVNFGSPLSRACEGARYAQIRIGQDLHFANAVLEHLSDDAAGLFRGVMCCSVRLRETIYALIMQIYVQI